MNLKTILSPHPSAALEYWFFKVNSGPIALLVDWIARRDTNKLWLRGRDYGDLGEGIVNTFGG
jgi:hypothetical protein